MTPRGAVCRTLTVIQALPFWNVSRAPIVTFETLSAVPLVLLSVFGRAGDGERAAGRGAERSAAGHRHRDVGDRRRADVEPLMPLPASW